MNDRGNAEGRVEVWGVVAEMQEDDVKPNRVTCSNLLERLDAYSEELNIARTMSLISNMDEPMDEVFLSSAVKACVRIRKPELLSVKLEQLKISPAAATQGHVLQPPEGASTPTLRSRTSHGPWTSSATWTSPWTKCCSRPLSRLVSASASRSSFPPSWSS